MTCGPENSAQWNKEMWEYSNKSFNGITDPKEYKEFVRTFNTAFEDDSLIWKELKKQKNTLTRIDMYGGEPMLMLKQWKFLEQLIEDDLAKNISLHYNTNGTIWDEEKYNTLKEFKNVSIDFSIDGLEEQFEYMRFPANWNEVRNNMEEISKFNFDLSICHTVSSLNVWYIKEFLDHFNKWNYYLNLVHGPPEYNIQNLSNKIKAYVTEKYKDDERAKQIISFMNNKSSIYNGHDGFLKAFRNKVGFSDKFRGNDYTLTFPEFASMIEY